MGQVEYLQTLKDILSLIYYHMEEEIAKFWTFFGKFRKGNFLETFGNFWTFFGNF
jgi:hypothetical protein